MLRCWSVVGLRRAAGGRKGGARRSRPWALPPITGPGAAARSGARALEVPPKSSSLVPGWARRRAQPGSTACSLVGNPTSTEYGVRGRGRGRALRKRRPSTPTSPRCKSRYNRRFNDDSGPPSPWRLGSAQKPVDARTTSGLSDGSRAGRGGAQAVFTFPARDGLLRCSRRWRAVGSTRTQAIHPGMRVLVEQRAPGTLAARSHAINSCRGLSSLGSYPEFVSHMLTS